MEKLPNDEKNGESATKIEYFGDRKTCARSGHKAERIWILYIFVFVFVFHVLYFGDRKTYKEVSRKRPYGREKETRGGELLHGYKC